MLNPNSTVLISGASSGIGKLTADYLAAKGYRVFAGLRRPGSASFAENVETVQLDVTDESSVNACIETVLGRAGRIDVLVNNAGISLIGPIEETSIAQAREAFETNVFGVLRLSHAVLPAMRRQNFGRVVNVSSTAGFAPAPYMGIYSATKHAIEALTEALDQEIRNFGIRVVLVEPTFVRTNIGAAAQGELLLDAYTPQRDRVTDYIRGRVEGAPDGSHVAQGIERAMKAGKFRRIPIGFEARLQARLRRFLPAGLFDRAVRRAFRLDP